MQFDLNPAREVINRERFLPSTIPRGHFPLNLAGSDFDPSETTQNCTHDGSEVG